MANQKHVIKTNQNDTVMINTTGDTWIINPNVTINVANEYGILESGSGNTIKVLGDIKVSGDTYAGVRFQGSNSSLNIGAKSVIDARNAESGIQYDGAGGHITVNGTIKGGDNAIHGNIWAVVANHGHLTGDAGMAFDDSGSDITNFKSIDATSTGIVSGAAETLIVNDVKGVIHAGSTGILLNGDAGDNSVIDNKGVIDAQIAVESTDDNLTLTNSGKIIGDVILGNGDDVLDTRFGTITGKIEGNNGDDTFYVSKSSTKITEDMGGGTDTVHSSASYNLSNGLENLILMGTKDLHGGGNKFDNELTGNKGDNELIGRNGADTLNGGKGNDILEGDLGIDTFVFNTGGGKDKVVDFHDGEDLLMSNKVQSMADFDDLNITQHGQDTIIHFGDGDTLTLVHFIKGDLSYADFTV